MESPKSNNFLARHGATLIDAGYHIIPIKRGGKRPVMSSWSKIRSDKALLRQWLEQGYGKHGIGIITGDVIAVDLDVRDEEIVKALEDWCHFNIGFAPVRIGQAPKRLLIYKADEPFSKLVSKSYDNPALADLPPDDKGRIKRPENRIEILARGQQFVAYAIHPDTGKPYEWRDGDPLQIPFDELPLITKEQALELIAEYERLASEAGWESTSGNTTPAMATLGVDEDDWFNSDTQKVEISEDEFHRQLLLVPPQSGYDGWLQIGMALYHQYDGGERGLELWHEWSQLAYPDDYDADEIDDKWKHGKLDISDKGRAPITARLILKLAKEHQQELETQIIEELKQHIVSAKDINEITLAAEKIKKVELNTAARNHLVGILRDRFKMVTGTPLSLKDAREMVRYENPSIGRIPKWLEGWVFAAEIDSFFNTESKMAVSKSTFDSMNARFMLTKRDVLEGKARPDNIPSDVALNIHQIPVVSGLRYFPGMGDIFTMNGVKYANTYSDRNIPEVPEKLTKRDKENIEIVRRHFTHLFPDEREARIFLDYIAYIVQNPGKRPGWAVLLQGTEGDGKSFFGVLLGAVLGADNVMMLNAKTIQGDFNGWAEGRQVVFVEEIRLHGHNRYDVLNQVKPLITNEVIDIHRKRLDPYNIPNMSSYLLATNYRDALPLNDNDSRYFVLFSRFQSKVALDEFKASNPDYYSNLYQTLRESAGAIRGWLLNHEFGPDFTVGNRAPESKAKQYMIRQAKSEEEEVIEDIIKNSLRFDISRTLLSATDLADELMTADEPSDVPYGRRMNKILSDMGFLYLGKFKVDGRYRRYWSMEPERFMVDGQPSSEKIREWVSTDL